LRSPALFSKSRDRELAEIETGRLNRIEFDSRAKRGTFRVFFQKEEEEKRDGSEEASDPEKTKMLQEN